MKKGLIVGIIIFFILLALGGGLYLATNKNHAPAATPTTANSAKSNTVFNSIQDALQKSLSLSCDYTTASGGHVVAYIKNGEIRTDITGKTPQESGSMIMKDKKIYFWNAQMGIMMDEPVVSITPNPAVTKTPSQGENTLAEMEKYKESCKAATVPDSLFALPTNVKFTDQSQMMRQVPSVYPTGTSGSGGYAVPSQYQQYMPTQK